MAEIRESITGRLAGIFQKKQVVAQAPAAITSGVVDARQIDTILRDWNETFSLQNDRQSRYTDFETMDVGDIAVVLDAIVAQALTFEEASEDIEDSLLLADCFKVEFSKRNTVTAKNIIRQVLDDTEIRDELPEIARDMVKNGDEFVELLWDNDEIVGIQPHMVRDMYANKDNKGRFYLGTNEQGQPLAYQQRAQDSRVVAGWYPYQMLHFKLYPTKKLAYSRKSFLDTLRYDWKKLSWLEQGMVLARTTRAYPRLLWIRDMTGKDTKTAENIMHRFMLALQNRKTNSGSSVAAPMSPDEDYYMSGGYIVGADGKYYPRQDKVELLDPNLAGLGSITDITYMRRKLFSIVPAAIVGIFDSFQSDMTPQDIALARFVKRIQGQLEVQIRLMFDRALIAKGIDPKSVSYRIIWPRTTIHTDWRYADGRFRNSMADQNYNAMDIISKKFIRQREFGMTSDESDAEEEQINTEKEELNIMPPTNAGQGQGDGSGQNGKPAVQQKKSQSPTTIAKKRTAGFNSGPKNSPTEEYDELRDHHASQINQIQQFAPTDAVQTAAPVRVEE